MVCGSVSTSSICSEGIAVRSSNRSNHRRRSCASVRAAVPPTPRTRTGRNPASSAATWIGGKSSTAGAKAARGKGQSAKRLTFPLARPVHVSSCLPPQCRNDRNVFQLQGNGSGRRGGPSRPGLGRLFQVRRRRCVLEPCCRRCCIGARHTGCRSEPARTLHAADRLRPLQKSIHQGAATGESPTRILSQGAGEDRSISRGHRRQAGIAVKMLRGQLQRASARETAAHR